MADIHCTTCGEPWDTECLHELVGEAHERSEWLTKGQYDQNKYDKFYAEARALFRKEGCRAFHTKHSMNDPVRAAASAAMFDIMGDDIDGIASTMDDFDFLGMLD